MPNVVAYLILFSWPAISWALFRALPIPRAIILTLLLGYLFLPTEPQIDLPMLPALDKNFVPALSATIFAWLYARKADKLADILSRRASSTSSTQLHRQGAAVEEDEPWRKPRRKSRISLAITLLITTAVIGAWLTALGNREAIVIPKQVLSALRPYDGASMTLALIVQLLPFWLARRHLVGREVQLEMVRLIALCALGYSVLALIEVRMAPQLNTWIYGYFPHSFAQHMREGGFRPIVFLEHGLRVGIFLSLGILASATLARLNVGPARLRWLAATGYLCIVLYISKNLGAVLITTVILPTILIASMRLQILAAALISAVVMLYPIGRGLDIIPVDRMVDIMETASAQRAASFQTRLENETRFLEKANLKPLAGWGGWGRERIYNEEGRDISIADGTWIILIGQNGWIGYIGRFGLLCFPAFFVAVMRRRLEVDVLLTGPLLMVAANLVDLIPNSSNVPMLWMMAGALWSQIDARRTAFNPDDLPRRQRARGAAVAKRRPRIVIQR